MSKGGGKRMMEAFTNLFSKQASKLLLENQEEQHEGSYLLKLGVETVREATVSLNNILPILTSLMKINVGGPPQVRGYRGFLRQGRENRPSFEDYCSFLKS